MVRYDVAIVGSGPAGAAAALTADRLGLRAVIVDKAEFPRDKTCGDGLTTNALRLIEELGVTRESLTEPEHHPEAPGDAQQLGGYTRIDDIVLIGPRGRTVEIPLPRNRGDYACVVSRWRLDAALANLVADTSIERRLGVAVESLSNDPRGVTLKLHDGETIEADFVIAADGHWSAIRKGLRDTHNAYQEPQSTDRDLGEWHAVRQYFSNASDRRLWVLFEPDLLPGYFWVFPLPNGRANVGYGVLRNQGRTGKELKALWPDLLARPHIKRILGPNAQPEGTVKAWPIPTNYHSATMSDGRVLYVGDAAKVVDPMTGEGIAQAIETGMLAAESIAHFRRTANPETAVGTQYRASVHQTLGRDLNFAAKLQSVLAHEVGARAALRVVDTNAWTRRNFARWMFEDYPRAVIFTPDRWRPNPFRQPAAFLRK